VRQAWVNRYNGPGNHNDGAYALAVDASGNIYVTGGSYGLGTSSDYATVKYNSPGVEQWVARYNGPGNYDDVATALAVDASGNIYVTGYSYGSGTSSDYATVKYNSSGVEQWVARYNGPGNYDDVATALAVDASGNIYVTGGGCFSGTYYDYATVKYNSSGVWQWVARYNKHLDDVATAIAIDESGNIYVTGGSYGLGTGDDYATVKYDSSGEPWVARYNGPGNDYDEAYALAVDGSGNVYVTGYSYGSGTSSDYATVKYNSSGVEQWVARYNGPGNGIDEAYAIAVDASDNIYVTGGSYFSVTNYDYATVKYNSSGVEQWVARYNGPGNDVDVSYALAVDASGNVYVTGLSPGSGTNNDYATVKYEQVATSVREVGTSVPVKFVLEQNYPNPFNPTTTIEFSIPGSEFVTLKIYNTLAQEIATLVSERLTAGKYKYEWDANGLASGVYLYRIQAGDYVEVRKMLLLR
jgi:uncharacterized delta-60 repeat protein